MLTHPLTDNPRRIEQFLEGQLSDADARQIELHLETCAECRGDLETAAADESYWSLVPTYLSDDALDCDFATGVIAEKHSGWVCDDKPELLRITDYFDPTDDPRMMGRFGGYEIAGIVGSGGMGVVLKGFETALDRYVAIKVLAPHLATSGAARTRFAREARAAAAVIHENVVSIHRVSEANGLPFLVMPYIAGDSLVKRLDERGPLELHEILRIGAQIAAGLAAAHAQGLVHRDIKPGNILLGSGIERVTITDFGLARAADDASLTRSGVITGTPQFMSPEQARGEPVDARSDLFSLGSVLYAMCAGRPPFRADTAYGVLRRISEGDPRPIRGLAPELPEWLPEIVQKLHAKNAVDRFQSATEVAQLLGRWLAHIEQPTTSPAPARVEWPAENRLRPRWNRWWRLAAAIVVAASLAVLLAVAIPRALSPGNSATNENSAGTNSQPITSLNPIDEPPIDEAALISEFQQVRGKISQFHHDWSTSPPSQNLWESAIPELRMQLENLTERIDQSGP
jgi:eukaryotic-like serine/threonine-protein kinase